MREEDETTSAKKPYKAPTLTIYGTVSTMTLQHGFNPPGDKGTDFMSPIVPS